ncbi:MAG: hypothetical protein HY360_11920 [Verrucomicrobia bacterium]|nr:hypothetical protein [Verrucomicrobiota bacterium]
MKTKCLLLSFPRKRVHAVKDSSSPLDTPPVWTRKLDSSRRGGTGMT